ncbi:MULTISPECIES: glycosyltransferase family 2 protein [unclassified Crossiella]|uniref:glycosyltransferase family 2 protein n=1 Tax=unclassified Crossiella TaxID=2620835 RepID=UPI001FFEB1C5|nr:MULTISPECIES: cellulose synthase catalytic subunit [unclassified Crossiella]MCK2237831.1 glycosyltransferase [Crossiella sp. S99.2]MCK2255117.1 glycosyltransferase [Crossiella sp. S99.1]
MSQSTLVPIPPTAADSPADPAALLPRPPGDEEVYWYFGPQRRWVLVLSSLSFVFTAVALFQFSVRTPWLWLFLGVLVLNVAGVVMSLLDNGNPRRVSREQHDLLVRVWRPAVLPSVDVYLPTCGEPIPVLRNAYQHVSRLGWDGRLRIWVLDDGARREVRELAAEFGFDYVVRPDRGHLKKAGNLNHALTVSAGELIVILDADFCPRPDLLVHLAPYFEDAGVGIVQTPQCFATDASMNWLQRAAGAAQEWFFRWIQPSRDANDAAICCGSNAMYRRAAIEEVGGFAKLDHSEDMYTGLALLGRGYRTQYLPLLLAKGLSPDTVPAFVSQQYRWAMGNLHLLTAREVVRVGAGRRLLLSYWNGVVSYLLTAVNVFAAPLPPLIMLALTPGDVRPWHMLPFLLPVWTWLVLIPAVSRTRWSMQVIRAHQLVGFASAAAVWHTLRGHGATWVPTGVSQGRGGLARRVSLIAFAWLGITTLAGWIGFAAGVFAYGIGNYWALAGYLLVQGYLSVPLLVDLANSLWRPDRQSIGAGNRWAATAAHRSWPELLAITVTLGMFGLLASGLVDGIL